MFTSEVDRRAVPLRARAWGMTLGSLLMALLAAALVSARTIPFLLAVVLVGFLLRAAHGGWLADVVHRPGPLHMSLAALLGWSLITTLWSLDAAHALTKLLVAATVVLGASAIVGLSARETRINLLHIAEGIWIGLLIGLSYFLVELLSGQAIKIWLYNFIDLSPADLPHGHYFRWRRGDIVRISPVDLTRNASSITLVMWGAMLAAIGSLEGRSGKIVAAVIALLAVAVVALGTQETSKLALVVGLATFAAALLSRDWTWRLMAAGWLFACLLVMPLALALHKLDLHNASFVPKSGQHRIIIWNYTAERALQAPVLGIGMHSTHELGPSLRSSTPAAKGETQARTLSRHAHNVYLQTWFELGAVGALLLALTGLATLWLVRGLPAGAQPYALATFACAAVLGGASYGMWQIWYMAMYGMAFVIMGLAVRIYASGPALAPPLPRSPQA
ncbi:MAG: O-antigen ligase family protein [Pseudomonadota bacterium]